MHLLLQFCLACSMVVGCSARKLGTCPAVGDGAGTCAEECWSDYDCPGEQKCCSNGCGHVCMTPTPSLISAFFPTSDYVGWPNGDCIPCCVCVTEPCPCCPWC